MIKVMNYWIGFIPATVAWNVVNETLFNIDVVPSIAIGFMISSAMGSLSMIALGMDDLKK